MASLHWMIRDGIVHHRSDWLIHVMDLFVLLPGDYSQYISLGSRNIAGA